MARLSFLDLLLDDRKAWSIRITISFTPSPFFFSLSYCYVLSDSPLRALVHTLCLYGLRKGDDGGGQPGGGERMGDTKVAWVVFEIALLVFFFFFIHSIPVA